MYSFSCSSYTRLDIRTTRDMTGIRIILLHILIYKLVCKPMIQVVKTIDHLYAAKIKT